MAYRFYDVMPEDLRENVDLVVREFEPEARPVRFFALLSMLLASVEENPAPGRPYAINAWKAVVTGLLEHLKPDVTQPECLALMGASVSDIFQIEASAHMKRMLYHLFFGVSNIERSAAFTMPYLRRSDRSAFGMSRDQESLTRQSDMAFLAAVTSLPSSIVWKGRTHQGRASALPLFRKVDRPLSNSTTLDWNMEAATTALPVGEPTTVPTTTPPSWWTRMDITSRRSSIQPSSQNSKLKLLRRTC